MHQSGLPSSFQMTETFSKLNTEATQRTSARTRNGMLEMLGSSTGWGVPTRNANDRKRSLPKPQKMGTERAGASTLRTRSKCELESPPPSRFPFITFVMLVHVTPPPRYDGRQGLEVRLFKTHKQKTTFTRAKVELEGSHFCSNKVMSRYQ